MDLTQQDRTVTQSFNHGFLTGISDFAPSIQYHPSGMVSQVEHGNGVRWSQAADPTGMARPYRIRTHGASDDLNTGIIEYDGAGNIVRTGADRYLYDQVSRVKEADLGKYPVSCAKSRTVLGGDDTAASYDSCGTMDVGPYTIGSSGKVTLRAEGTIAFHDGFSVEAGGTLAAESGAVLDLSPAGPTQRTQSYQYDRFGNLTFVTTDGIGQSLDTDPATNHKTGAYIDYDASGNLAAQPITVGKPWQYRYDPFNMLWDVTRLEGGGWINVYGPGDERTWVIDWTGGSDVANWKETYTLRGLDGAPLRQYAVEGGNASGHWSLTRDYIWRGNALLAAVRDPGTTNEKTVYFHPDHLGSPRILTDAAGDTIETHVYFPFGQEAYVNPGDGDVLQFTGHERDDYAAGDTVDLDYMHARYYSLHLGRFLSTDPVAGNPSTPQSWNLYGYVLGNPVKYTDPEGLFPIFPLGEIPFFFDDITVTAQMFTLTVRAFNPLTGVAGLNSLAAGRGFLNSLQGSGDSFLALTAWATGQLPRNGVATPEMAAQLSNTPGMENIRAEYRRAGCKDGRYSSDYQYRELLTTTNLTGQLVGGFVADITSVSGGMVVVDAQNTWGLESATRLPGTGNRGNASVQQMLSGSGGFQYPKSLLENRAYGPMGTATLHYIWAESLSCP